MKSLNIPENAADQYRDSSNLRARVQLHDRFSTNPQGWIPWVFDQLHLRPHSKILELGSGPGGLWQRNLDRIPEKCSILLTDFTEGMVREARQTLEGKGDFEFRIVDANTTPLPFADSSFDTVIANHMLYYVSDRQGLFSEIVRVLKPGGRFYTSTIGRRHLIEIVEWISEFDPAAGATWGHPMSAADSFTLENGEAQLTPWFHDIRLFRYDDALVVNEVTPLLDYIFSGWTDLEEDRRKLFGEFLTRKMKGQAGTLHITKDSGIFEAVRR